MCNKLHTLHSIIHNYIHASMHWIYFRRWGQDVTIIKGLSNGYMAISSGSDDEIRSALRSDLQQDTQTDIQSNIQSDIHMPVHYIHTKIAMSNTSTSNVSSLHDNSKLHHTLQSPSNCWYKCEPWHWFWLLLTRVQFRPSTPLRLKAHYSSLLEWIYFFFGD